MEGSHVHRLEPPSDHGAARLTMRRSAIEFSLLEDASPASGATKFKRQALVLRSDEEQCCEANTIFSSSAVYSSLLQSVHCEEQAVVHC